MAVQTFVTLAFIITFFDLIILASIVIRLPLKAVLQYEWMLLRICYLCTGASCKFTN